jgi:uncharacterized protein (TIGR00299 family) protein
MKVVYIQSIGGASGDMLLGALLDLGLPLESLTLELNKLGITGYQLSASQETRCEVRGTKLTVSLQNRSRLSPKALLDVVQSSPLSPSVIKRSEKVLTALWAAESRVHGEPETVLQLEELGTIDTLIDVVGFTIGLEALGIEQAFASPLVLGSAEPPRWPGGYSNPAPATLELVAMAGAPVVEDRPIYRGAGELTTPTGAAIITTLASFERPAMSVTGIGIGLGGKDPEGFPNVVRIWLGEVGPTLTAKLQGEIMLLETNLDDVTGEVLAYAQEVLFKLGALDVWHTPIQMKKNRPGIILSALVPQNLEAAAAELILRETPTLGVRTRPVERYVAERESFQIDTELGTISVKVKSLAGKPISASPEFEDCRRIALELGIPLQEVYQRVQELARRRFLD